MPNRRTISGGKGQRRLCEEIDKYRTEIEFSYLVENMTVRKISEIFKESYGLDARPHQYRDRLIKWGCHKNIKSSTYKQIKPDIDALRQKGQDVEIILNDSVVIPSKRVKKGLYMLDRNETFTERIFREAAEASGGNLLQRTINNISTNSGEGVLQLVKVLPKGSTFDEGLSFPFPSFRPPISPDFRESLPINISFTQLRRVLQDLKILPPQLRESQLEIRSTMLLNNHSVIKEIFYRLSNGFYDSYKLNALLSKTYHLQARDALAEILKTRNNLSIKAACEHLLHIFYVWQDFDLVAIIQTSYPGIVLNLYAVLKSSDYFDSDHHARMRMDVPRYRRNISKNPNYILLTAKVLDQIGLTKQKPQNADEAALLLYACIVAQGSLSLFLLLWDKTSISLERIEQAYWETYKISPLSTQNISLLTDLLSHGFKYRLSFVLLNAIATNDTHLVLAFFSHSSCKDALSWTDFSRSVRFIGSNARTSRYIWDSIPYEIFNDILHNFLLDLYFRPPFDERLSLSTALAILVTLNPRIEEYLVECIKRIYTYSTRANGQPFFILWRTKGTGQREPIWVPNEWLEDEDVYTSSGLNTSKVSRIKVDWAPLIIWSTVKHDKISKSKAENVGVYFKERRLEYLQKFAIKVVPAKDKTSTIHKRWSKVWLEEEDISTFRIPEVSTSSITNTPNLEHILLYPKKWEIFLESAKGSDEDTLPDQTDFTLGDVESVSRIILGCDKKSRKRYNGLRLIEKYSGSCQPNAELDYIGSKILGMMALFAIKKNDGELTIALLELIKRQYQIDNVNVGLLLYAAAQDPWRLESLKMLLRWGAPVNEPNDFSKTAIYSAIETGNIDTMAYLLEVGADLHVRDYRGITPVEYAAAEGRLDAVALMIHVEPEVKQVALEAAQTNGRWAIVEYIQGLDQYGYPEQGLLGYTPANNFPEVDTRESF